MNRGYLVTLLALGLVTGGVAVATSASESGRHTPPDPGVAVQVADPAGGPPWAAVTHRTDREFCISTGRLVDGELGRWTRHGFLEGAGTHCGPITNDLVSALGGEVIAADPTTEEQPRSLAVGAVAAEVQDAAVLLDGNRWKATIGEDGVFLVVIPGDSLDGSLIELVTGDGRTVRRQLGP